MSVEIDSGPDGPGEYKVGYKRPPLETRFKAGQPSANPRGRVSVRDYNAAELLLKPVKAKISGKARKPAFALAVIEITKAAALKGDKRATREIIKLLTKHEIFRRPETQHEGTEGLPAVLDFVWEFPDGTVQRGARPV